MNKHLINILSFTFITFVYLLILYPNCGFTQSIDNTNQTLIRHIDFTGDGVEDEIKIQLRGESWVKPLDWILTLSTKGKQIFERETNDAKIDSFFNDNAFVDGSCKSYLECKKQYYVKYLIANLFIKTDLSKNMHAFDKNNSGSIHYVAKNELVVKYNLSESEANETVEWMIKKIKSNKAYILYLPLSPVLSDLPRMFVDRVGKFVTIYQW